MEKIQIRNKNNLKGIIRNGNKIRHRLSDAKWRANVADCYSRLGRILINSELSCKVKITKATVLKETANHILFLENTIEALMREKAHRSGNTYGPLPWENSLDYFRSNFLIHEEDAKNENSHDASNFTSTMSSQPILSSTDLGVQNKVESIIPLNFTPSLHDGLCIEGGCYHLTATTFPPYLTSQNQTLQFICPKQNEMSMFEIKRGQRNNKEHNGMRRRPLKEINNISKTKIKKHFSQDYIKKCCRMGRSSTDLQNPALQSPFHNPNFCYHCPPTPKKVNKYKESLSQKRSVRTRRSLEKLMNNTTCMEKMNCEENNVNLAIEVKIQQDAEYADSFIFPQMGTHEASSLSLNNNSRYNSNKLSKEVLKAPVIMKVQKAIGSLKDKSHDQMTIDKKKLNSYKSHSSGFALEYMNSNSKEEADLFKLEETNQEVPDKETLCKKNLQSNVDVQHLPDIHYHNGDLAVLLLCKNASSKDQEVPELSETTSYICNQLKNSVKSNKSFASLPYKSFKDNPNETSKTVLVPETINSFSEKLKKATSVIRQDVACEIIPKSSSHETTVKNSMESSQNFLIQEKDPILTSATFALNQTSLTEHPCKNCHAESPSKNSTDDMQDIACQQVGCCWSPCQELSSSSLFDTGYHEANEIL